MNRRTTTAGTVLAVLAGLVVSTAAQSASADPSPPPSSQALAVSAADRAAASGLDVLAKGPDESYQRQAVTPWVNDLYSVAYERSYRGLPVVGGDAVVLADGQGRVRATQSATDARISVPTQPSVNAAAAEATSRAKLASVDKVESHRLVVRVKDGHSNLAWETVVAGRTATAPSRLHVFVDASTGTVLDAVDDVKAGTGNSQWNGPNPISIDTQNSGGTYSLRDPGRPGLSCADYSSGTVFSKSTDSWGDGQASSKETGCADVMWAAQKEWNMLRDWLGRNGHNGTGGSWPVKVGLSDVNAYWDGSSVSIGHNQANQWIGSMDVVGHEFGHGIDQFTPGGAGTEPGLGESTGDIMGALTEAYTNEPSPYDTPDYTVGETVNLVGQGPIRYMYKPSTNGDPDCYSSSIPNTEEHAAAGPLNHWFYLLAEGTNPGGGKPTSPTCNNTTLTGVGVQQAGKIFYGGMLLKTSGMNYKKYRTATLSSAKTLDATCGLFNKTKAAWDAISVPAQSGDPTCTGNPNPDFSIALSPTSGSAAPGGTTTSTVSTTAIGTAQTVALTASGQPSGVGVAFSPSSVQSGASSTLTATVGANVAPGSYPITVTGTGTGLSHTAQYTLTVTGTGTPDFSLSLSPTSGSAAPGGTTTSAVSTAITAGSAQSVALTATGQPTGVGVSFNPSSVQSGASSTLTATVGANVAPGSYPITVTGTGTSATHSATYTLTVTGTGGNALANGGFEQGTQSWTQSANIITNSKQATAHGGSWYAWMMGYGSTATETVTQTNVAIPAGSPQLKLWVKITTQESGSTVYDTLKVKIGNTTVATYSNANATGGYVQKTVNLSAYAGQTVTVQFAGAEDPSLSTTFLVDDVSIS